MQTTDFNNSMQMGSLQESSISGINKYEKGNVPFKFKEFTNTFLSMNST